MANLLKETEEFLKVNRLSFDDVIAVQLDGLRISLEHFRKLAKKTNYDAGYGIQMVNPSLTMVLTKHRWITREEYDGAEWWMLHRMPRVHRKTSDDSVKTLMDNTMF